MGGRALQRPPITTAGNSPPASTSTGGPSRAYWLDRHGPKRVRWAHRVHPQRKKPQPVVVAPLQVAPLMIDTLVPRVLCGPNPKLASSPSSGSRLPPRTQGRQNRPRWLRSKGRNRRATTGARGQCSVRTSFADDPTPTPRGAGWLHVRGRNRRRVVIASLHGGGMAPFRRSSFWWAAPGACPHLPAPGPSFSAGPAPPHELRRVTPVLDGKRVALGHGPGERMRPRQPVGDCCRARTVPVRRSSPSMATHDLGSTGGQ